MKKILFIYPVSSTFVERDFEILRQRYDMIRHYWVPEKNIFRFCLQIARLKLSLFRSYGKVAAIYCWFVDYHSLLPVLFGKLAGIKTILIVGGYDAVCLPGIRFGLFCSNFFRVFCARVSYRYADYICPVDKSLIRSNFTYSSAPGNKTGFRHFIKKIPARVNVIPTGYDSEYWKRYPNEEKKKQIIAAASITDKRRFYLKGFDLLLSIAGQIPEASFVLVGFSRSFLENFKQRIPDNVLLLQHVNRDKLRELYARSGVIAQLSLSEGLPNTLCEAMLCECIPVGSAVCGIPDAIGDAGYLLPEKDPDKAVELFREALASGESLGKHARNRIKELFPASGRQEKLYEIIDEIMAGGNK